MYPTDFTQLTGLVAVLVPLIIAACAGFSSVRTKASENNQARWLRVHELAAIINNANGQHGLWAQLAAIHELGEVSHPRKDAAGSILAAATLSFATNVNMGNALAKAQTRLNRRSWLSRVCWNK